MFTQNGPLPDKPKEARFVSLFEFRKEKQMKREEALKDIPVYEGEQLNTVGHKNMERYSISYESVL